MADSFDISIPECKNRIITALWMEYTGTFLEKYTKDGLQGLYQDIYGQLAHLPPCVNRCSETHGCLCQQWCRTCREWRDKLRRVRRHPGVKWEKTQSWMWPIQYENIAEVFVPPNWTRGSPTFKDISTMCSIWDNCLAKFKIKRAIIRRLRDERNKLVHDGQVRVSRNDKKKLYDVLNDLFHDPDVKSHVDTKDCIDRLTDIAERSYGDEETRNIVRQGQNEFQRYMKQLMEMQEGNSKRLKNILILTSIVIVVLISLSSTIVWITTTVPRQNHKPDNNRINKLSRCLPDENYQYPFVQDFPQAAYISEHQELFGRQWIFDDIKQHVFKTLSNSSGVIITADIGYGKSAIVSHLLCDQKSDNGSSIRNNIVAFHVCRFDVESTKKGERFIRRLTGFFSSKSAEYGSIIEHLSNQSIVYDRDKCEKELEACFDQGIVFPLRQIDTPSDVPWLVIVDALDECSDMILKENALINILSRGIKKLPSWIKFVITSRKTTDLRKLKSLERSDLHANDIRNINDIKLYIKNKVIDNVHVRKIVEMCHGNFQFARHVIMHITRFENFTGLETFPQTLNEIYEADFERVFPNDVSFEPARRILEVLCTTISPLTTTEFITILPHMNLTNNSLTLELEKLSFYIRTSINNQLVFVHQSISEWLVSGNSPRFALNPENGHQILSSYMMKLLNSSSRIDVVDLAIHVAGAGNPSLTTLFSTVVKHYAFESTVLHKLIWRTCEIEALRLILTAYKDVDSFNRARITPAFVAASKGHLEQLRLLHKFGANLNFRVGDDNVMFFHNESLDEIISLHNNLYYTGYNLIQVATKHGHVSTVDYLLAMNKSSIYVRNAIGYRASDIACEKGYLNILEIFSLAESDVVDKHCLFLASKYNRLDILQFLMKTNISLNCITDQEALMSIKNMNQNEGVKFAISEFGSMSYKSNISFWWLTLKETPLHAALKHGHYDAFNMIVNQYPNLLECIDYLGYTPVLKSIVYNTTYILNPHIRERLLIDKCGNQSALPINIPLFLQDETCPAGATYAHLIALYDRSEIIMSLLSQNITIDWNTPDDESMMPVHYACIKDNMRIIVALSYVNFDFKNARTQRGFTPFHIVCKAGHYSSYLQLTRQLKFDVPVMKDQENRSVLFHTVLREFSGLANNDEILQYNHYQMFKHIMESKGQSLFDVDIYNRNIIHYVLRNGHIHIIRFLLTHFANDVRKLLRVSDKFNQTPISFALDRDKDATNNIFPTNCLFTDVFFSYCNISSKDYLLSWEYSLYIIMHLSSKGQVNNFLIVSQLDRIFRLSPYLTTAFLVFIKDTDKAIIQRHILAGFTLGMNNYSLFAIAKHRPDAFIECDKPLHASPLHLIALKFPLILHRSDVRFFFKSIFGEPIKTKLLSCNDQSGYNIFHYAVKADNAFLADILLELGIHVLTPTINVDRIMWMILLTDSRNQISDDALFNSKLSDISFDDVLLQLLRRSNFTLQKRDVCSNMSRELSLIHFLAINGFVKTISSIRKRYGKRIVSCTNIDGFTPLYLAKVFNHSQTVTYLEKRKILSLPKPLAEAHLLYNLENNFFPFHNPSFTLPSITLIVDTYNLNHQQKKLSPSQPNPFKCLRNDFRHGVRYKQMRMLKCINTVIKVCKSIPNNDVLMTALLHATNITNSIYTATRQYIALKLFINELITNDSEADCMRMYTRLFPFLSKLHSKTMEAITQLKIVRILKMIHVNRRVSSLLFLSEKCTCVHSVDRFLPILDKIISLFLDVLHDVTVQISTRVIHSWFGKLTYPDRTAFFNQRLATLDLLIPHRSTSNFNNYSKQMYHIGQTYNRHQYLSKILVSDGFRKYRDLSISRLHFKETFKNHSSTLNEVNNTVDYIERLSNSLRHKHGEKRNPFFDLDPGHE